MASATLWSGNGFRVNPLKRKCSIPDDIFYRSLASFGWTDHSAALDLLIGTSTHEEVSGSLFIGVTFQTGYEVISSWNSRESLINTMHASMHIPFYCSAVARPCLP